MPATKEDNNEDKKVEDTQSTVLALENAQDVVTNNNDDNSDNKEEYVTLIW